MLNDVHYINIVHSVQRVFEVGPHLYVGLPGLVTDTQTVIQRLQFRVKMYEMRFVAEMMVITPSYGVIHR